MLPNERKKIVSRWQNCQTIKTKDEFFVLIIGYFDGKPSLGAYWHRTKQNDFPNAFGKTTTPLLIPTEFAVPILLKVRNEENKKIIDKFLKEVFEKHSLDILF